MDDRGRRSLATIVAPRGRRAIENRPRWRTVTPDTDPSAFSGASGPPSAPAPRPRPGPYRVQLLEQVVRDELDLLVTPFRGAVMAGDDPHAVQAAEVAVDEGVPRLGAVVRALGEPEVPRGVFVPRVPGQVGVLVLGGGLNPAPLAAEHVLPSVDQLPRVGDPCLVHPVLRHRHP